MMKKIGKKGKRSSIGIEMAKMPYFKRTDNRRDEHNHDTKHLAPLTGKETETEIPEMLNYVIDSLTGDQKFIEVFIQKANKESRDESDMRKNILIFCVIDEMLEKYQELEKFLLKGFFFKSSDDKKCISLFEKVQKKLNNATVEESKEVTAFRNEAKKLLPNFGEEFINEFMTKK